MDKAGYRKTSRTNIIATWVCSVILAGLSFRNYGLATEFFSTAAVMFGTSLLITTLYFLPVKESLKGGIIVTIVGLATLLASVLQGGSDRNFIASFFVLALATLYFNSRIILAYSGIYLAVCGAACLVNPAYIDGTDYQMARVLIKLVIYGSVAAVLYAATRQGEGLIRRSQEAAQRIMDATETARIASENLIKSVDDGNGSTQEMADSIGRISTTSASVKTGMNRMLEQVDGMRAAVNDSAVILQENLDCTRSLSDSYGNVLGGVRSGMQTAGDAGKAIRKATDMVIAANEASGQLQQQMARVGDILNHIHSIASKTNLLSVNASIEAAHSGVYGKGFAVVAGEIQALAVDSTEAAGDIQQIIDELIAATSLMSQRVTGSASLLQTGLEHIGQVDENLQSLETISGQVETIIRRENSLIEDFQKKYRQVETQLNEVQEQLRRSVDLVWQIDSSLKEQSDASQALSAQLEEIAHVSGQLQEQMG